MSRRNPLSVIFNPQFHPLLLRQIHAGNTNPPVCLDRLDRVDYDVQQHLFQLLGVAGYRRQVLFQPGYDLDVFRLGLRLHQFLHVLHHGVDFDVVDPVDDRPGVVEQLFDQRVHPLGFPHDNLQVFLLTAVDVVFLQQLGKAADRHQRVAHFMGQARCHFAHRRQPLGSLHLRLQLPFCQQFVAQPVDRHRNLAQFGRQFGQPVVQVVLQMKHAFFDHVDAGGQVVDDQRHAEQADKQANHAGDVNALLHFTDLGLDVLGQLIGPDIADDLAFAHDRMHRVHDAAPHQRPFLHPVLARLHDQAALMVLADRYPHRMAVHRRRTIGHDRIQLFGVIADADPRIGVGDFIGVAGQGTVEKGDSFLAAPVAAAALRQQAVIAALQMLVEHPGDAEQFLLLFPDQRLFGPQRDEQARCQHRQRAQQNGQQ